MVGSRLKFRLATIKIFMLLRLSFPNFQLKKVTLKGDSIELLLSGNPKRLLEILLTRGTGKVFSVR